MQEKRGSEDEMAGWHHQYKGYELGQTSGDDEGQRGLACCSPWGCRVRHDWVTEKQQIIFNFIFCRGSSFAFKKFIPTLSQITTCLQEEPLHVMKTPSYSWSILSYYSRSLSRSLLPSKLASLVAQWWRILPVQETWVRSLSREDPLEKEMATHSSILAWETPWTEESGRLQSIGLQRVGHNLVTKQQQQWSVSVISDRDQLF